jgi:hypothetical protein
MKPHLYPAEIERVTATKHMPISTRATEDGFSAYVVQHGREVRLFWAVCWEAFQRLMSEAEEIRK